MILLDCETTDKAYSSLEAILGSRREVLEGIFEGLDIPSVYEANPRTSLDPEGVVYQGVLSAISRVDYRADGVCWFHLTRVPDPSVFQKSGILPLNQNLHSIWELLSSLAGPHVPRPAWESFRDGILTQADHSAMLYAKKVGNSLHWGPYAILMREAALWPKEFGSHDYLRSPEIVEDICKAAAHRFGVDLLPAYQKATTPCVVKFVDRALKDDCISTVLYHLYTRHRSEEITLGCNTCLDRKTMPVAPEDIIRVETIG